LLYASLQILPPTPFPYTTLFRSNGWIRVVADKVVPRVRCAVVCLDMLLQRTRICELTGFGGVDASGTAITAATTREQYSRYGQAHRYNNAFWCTDKRSFGVRWS